MSRGRGLRALVGVCGPLGLGVKREGQGRGQSGGLWGWVHVRFVGVRVHL